MCWCIVVMVGIEHLKFYHWLKWCWILISEQLKVLKFLWWRIGFISVINSISVVDMVIEMIRMIKDLQFSCNSWMPFINSSINILSLSNSTTNSCLILLIISILANSVLSFVTATKYWDFIVRILFNLNE